MNSLLLYYPIFPHPVEVDQPRPALLLGATRLFPRCDLPSPLPTQMSNEHDGFPEDALLKDEAAGWSAQFVVPFQQSGPLPAVNPQPARASTNQTSTSAQSRATRRRFPVLRVALISLLIVLAVGFLGLSVFAQPASHLATVAKNPTQGPTAIHTTPAARPTAAGRRTPTPT